MTDIDIPDQVVAEEIAALAKQLSELIEIAARRGLETRLRVIPVQTIRAKVTETVIIEATVSKIIG